MHEEFTKKDNGIIRGIYLKLLIYFYCNDFDMLYYSQNLKENKIITM